MKRSFLFIFAFSGLIITSCKDTDKKKETASKDAATVSTSKTPISKLYGSYTGPFGDNKITVIISSVKDGTIAGSSVVAGNNRPFEGTFEENNENYTATAKEPGSDAHDGTFKFTISKDSPDKIFGTWKPYNTQLPAKDFVLDRRAFVYIKDVGTFPQASQRLLTTDDVENLYKDDLTYMRNEIFARHGYCFKTRDIRMMFDGQDWYVPISTDVTKELTSIEEKNIALIKRYEKHADEHGDDYGR